MQKLTLICLNYFIYQYVQVEVIFVDSNSEKPVIQCLFSRRQKPHIEEVFQEVKLTSLALVCWFSIIILISLALILLQSEISSFFEEISGQLTSCWARSTAIKKVVIIGQSYSNVLSRQVELFVDVMTKVLYIQTSQILVQLTFLTARVTF